MKTHILLAVAALALSTASGRLAADEPNMVGKSLPSLSSLNFQGSKPDLEGKPLLLEFWATWCPPCRKSIPHLNEIFAKYKDRGLAVVGVTEESNAIIRKFQKDVPMDYPTATDNGGRLAEKFGISGIPTAYLTDKSGTIVWQGHPMSLRDSDLEKALQ